MILASTLLLLGLLAVVVPVGRARVATVAAALLTLAAVVVDAAVGVVPAAVTDVLADLDVLALAGDTTLARALLLGALVWCGPAADLVVRSLLSATGLPAPEDAAAAGLRAGRWVGRLERWLLLLVIAAGQPALAVIPTGGKALLRYAEAVADARAGRPRLTTPSGDPPGPGRDAFLDYVLVGSFASWAQAITLGLLVAAA